MNQADMTDRGIGEFARIDIARIARDGSRRQVFGYEAAQRICPRDAWPGTCQSAAYCALSVTTLRKVGSR
jgi:hypothetical protein